LSMLNMLSIPFWGDGNSQGPEPVEVISRGLEGCEGELG
jgi:hypothetical protein